MALPDIRQRAGWLFVVVAVGHIVLISAQVNSRTGVPLLEEAVFGAFSGVQRAASGAVGAITSLWGNYVGLRHAARENAELRRQVIDLAFALQQERARSERAARLEALLAFPARESLRTLGANVVAGSVSPDARTVTIDRGTRDGLRRDSAVVSASGVVGRVVTLTARTAKVQLLIDRSAAAALVSDSREEGIVVGTGEPLLRLDYVASAAEGIDRGDYVLTSGIDGIYPKGLVIGQVESVERSGGAYKDIRVRPAARFSALEEVLVVVGQEVSAERREGPE